MGRAVVRAFFPSARRGNALWRPDHYRMYLKRMRSHKTVFFEGLTPLQDCVGCGTGAAAPLTLLRAQSIALLNQVRGGVIGFGGSEDP